MGIALAICGKLTGRSTDDALARIRAWLERYAHDDLQHATVGADASGRPTLFVGLHPSAEDVEIARIDDRFVAVRAKTSTTGPGYHAHLCELIDRIGVACGVAWEPSTSEFFDETGYFDERDARHLEGEFLAWLQGLANRLFGLADDGSSGLAISMPANVRFEADELLLTPVGPRSAAWLRDVAVDPARGIDLFPWWEAGKGAAYARGRALVHMWIDLPWRPPVDDAEVQLLRGVDALLAEAREKDPQIVLPWSAWSELRRHLGKATVKDGPPSRSSLVGYRRRDVWNALSGGWSLQAPGSFVGRFDAEGTWSAFDGERTLWFTSLAVKNTNGVPASAAELLPKGPRDGEPIGLSSLEGRAYRAHVSTENGGTSEAYTLLRVEVAAPGTLGVLSVAFRDGADLDLASSIAGTLAQEDT